MGILDDAIRAHLDLKREHGAPDDEISRQEREALGPARRGAPAEEEGSADDVAAEAAPEAPELEPEAPEPEPVAAEEPAAPVEADELPDDAALEPEADHPEPIEDPEPVVRSGDTPPRGTPAVEEPPAAEGDESEDVLEETPEFLQETPEHDRLWFEQKPPRDFDFDEE